MKDLFSIGEFSRVTGLTVKTLRYYHDERLLTPTFIDPNTGYRYYGPHKIEVARVITSLRAMDFSLDDIRQILVNHDDEADMLEFLERQKLHLEQTMQRYRDIAASVDRIIAKEKEARVVSHNAPYEVQEKDVEPMLIAGIRMKGKYSDCGQAFGKLFRSMGRNVAGKPMLLHYDNEYKEEDADFEACVPLRKAKQSEGVNVREVVGGRCVSLIHKGPYDELGSSYARILKYIKAKGYEVQMPTREVYIKGPGMIFRGNPKKYLTEIQMLVKTATLHVADGCGLGGACDSLEAPVRLWREACRETSVRVREVVTSRF